MSELSNSRSRLRVSEPAALLYAAGTISALVVGLEFLLRGFGVPSYLIPRPSAVGEEIVRNVPFFALHAGTTLVEAVVGAGIAIVMGVGVGSAVALHNQVRQTILPVLIAAQSMPIIVMAPLFVLWFGSGLWSKVAMATLLCWFPVIVNTTVGLRSFKNEHGALFAVLKASRWQKFHLLMLPSAVPYIVSGIKVCAGTSIIGAIVAEYAGAERGLGYVVMQSTYRLDTTTLFAAVVIGGACGLGLYALVVLSERLLLRRYRFGTSGN